MDNIVDYLVVGFFIISFLSSIFKKKKKNEAKTAENKPKQTVAHNRATVAKSKAKSPFDDFFKSINEELANAKADVSRSEVDEYYEQAMQNSDDTEVVVLDAFQQSKPTSLIPETVRQEKKGSIISIKSYTDSVEFTKAKRESEKAKDIKKSLLETNSIRNFIILNEVLGKPKALQR